MTPHPALQDPDGGPIPGSPFRLAASAEMVFTELALEDRLHAIGDMGLEAEIWGWTTKDLDAFASTGVPITSMTGYITGELIDPDGSRELLATAAASLEAAERIDCPRLNIHGTGLDPNGLPSRPLDVVSGADWLAALRTLEALAKLGERAGRTFTLENLNTAVDHPGTPFGAARDTLALVRAVDHPHLRLNLDLYHAQIGEGNLTELVREALPWVGEIQVADVPGRCEPGTGEINYPFIASALNEAGYTGVVAMEAWAASDSTLALERFIHAFSL